MNESRHTTEGDMSTVNEACHTCEESFLIDRERRSVVSGISSYLQ